MHNTNMFFSLMPVLSLVIYLIPLIFIVWFAISFLAVQKRRNEILQTIADRLNK
ncbi:MULTISPECIES: hypothetical protein [unclassified Sporosarcina]|uniref:hypothetical protein n=1 Tax=unclassified Sporosarcina TaxID=2647733 RepID=UPI0018C8CF0A|nr:MULTISPECIES: hypothetical protein [unclassified Sporosarcina]